MIIKAQVVDEKTNVPIEGASVYIVDQHGKYLGQGVAAGNDGKFSLDSPLLVGNYLLITHTQYAGRIIPTSVLNENDYSVIALPVEEDELPPVIVTPGSNSWWLLWLMLGVGAYVSRKKKKRGLA